MWEQWSMFVKCPKINRGCGFCGKSKWNPHDEKYDDTERLFCGLATGFDTRVEPLPQCWKDMSKSQIAKYRKQKREEYDVLHVYDFRVRRKQK